MPAVTETVAEPVGEQPAAVEEVERVGVEALEDTVALAVPVQLLAPVTVTV